MFYQNKYHNFNHMKIKILLNKIKKNLDKNKMYSQIVIQQYNSKTVIKNTLNRITQNSFAQTNHRFMVTFTSSCDATERENCHECGKVRKSWGGILLLCRRRARGNVWRVTTGGGGRPARARDPGTRPGLAHGHGARFPPRSVATRRGHYCY